MCSLFLSVSNLSCRLSFLLNLDNLLDLNLHLMFFVLRLPSLQSTWLLQRSVAVCHPSCWFCVTSLSTRLLSAYRLQSPLQSRLGVLSLSRQPSTLVQCCHASMTFSILVSRQSVQLLSSRHCSPQRSRPAVGTALSVLLIPPLLLGVLFSPAVGCALLPAVGCAFLPAVGYALLSLCSAE